MKKEKPNLVTFKEVRENFKKKGITEEICRKFLIEHKVPSELINKIIRKIFNPTEEDLRMDEITKVYLDSFDSESSSELLS